MNPALAKSVIRAKNNLAITARMAHWNVRGSDYYEAHLLFERIYEEAKAGTDTLAELLRSLGYNPTFEEFSGPGGSLPSYSRGELVDLLIDRTTSYYAALSTFRNSVKEDITAIGLVNLLEDLAQTCSTIMYLLSASKGR